jgi:hypothetical protein
MKKLLGACLLILAIAMLSAGCRQHKQSCAAYDKVEISK